MWVRNVVALGANAWAGCMVPSPSWRWSGTAGMPPPGHPPAAPLTASLFLSMARRVAGRIPPGVLVATVNFPFVTTQNFSLWACR